LLAGQLSGGLVFMGFMPTVTKEVVVCLCAFSMPATLPSITGFEASGQYLKP
jgi:hypothetical protein